VLVIATSTSIVACAALQVAFSEHDVSRGSLLEAAGIVGGFLSLVGRLHGAVGRLAVGCTRKHATRMELYDPPDDCDGVGV